MNAQQRHAWYNLAVLSAAVAAYLVLLPYIGPHRAPGAIGILGLWGFGALFYRRRGRPVTLDERDQMIRRTSVAIGYTVFWGAFVAGCMIPWFVLYGRGRETISIQVLPLLVIGGMVVVVITQSVVTLVLYRTACGPSDP